MTAKILTLPENILDENFEPDNLHPADLEQLLIAGYDTYENISRGSKMKRLYRDAYNRIVDLLSEKRGFTQFSHL